MKPGDLIEWVYKSDPQPVDEDVELWSTPMQRWIPIGIHPAVLISITDEFYTWLTLEGLFHARVDDTRIWPRRTLSPLVVPRVVGEHL
jgi:hypothetical protein